jgi:type II secretory pathway pseudopilin PulG
VELLVVLAIIALLIAMLLPALKKAKLAADGAKCASNLRTLIVAFRTFAEDNKGHLPGNKHESDNLAKRAPGASAPPWPEREAWRLDWMNGRLSGNAHIKEAPTKGTIWPYVRNKSVYACPTQEANWGTVEMFAGSNERFDYAYFNCFSGNKIAKVKQQAQFRDNRTGVKQWTPTPVLVQEHERSINGANMEGGHSESDKLSVVHNGGSYYAAVDGSAHFFREYDDTAIPYTERQRQPCTSRRSWFLEAPATKKLHPMGIDTYWGQWDSSDLPYPY